MMVWWTPEPLYQTFLGTDAEFERVVLPPPTQKCVDSRVDPADRCEGTSEEKQGDPAGACDMSPESLRRLVVNKVNEMSNDPSIPEGRRSPAYDAIKALSFSELQMGKIFDHWLERGVDKWNYDPREATCQWVVENFDYIQSLVPRTYPRVVQEREVKDPLFYVALVVACVAMIVVLLAIFGTYKYRKKQCLVVAQVEFLWMLLSGLLMIAIGAILLPLKPTDATCATIIWLTNLGYTLELVPLIIKVAAINRIMNAARRMRRVKLEKSTLFRAVFLLSGLVLIYLILWTALDRPRQSIDYELTDDKTENGETIILTTDYCTSGSDVWVYASTAWRTLLLVSATVLAFQSREAKFEFNESQVLGFLIYSQFVFLMLSVIVIMLESALDIIEISRYQSLVHSLDVIVACCIYFFPKFFAKETSNTTISGLSGNFTDYAEHPLSRLSRSNHASRLSGARVPNGASTTRPTIQVVRNDAADDATSSNDSAESDKTSKMSSSDVSHSGESIAAL
jgi:hypothetical protein